MTSTSSQAADLCRDHVVALTESMRQAVACIRSSDVAGLEGAVQRQQQLVDALKRDPQSLAAFAQVEPGLLTTLARQQSVLARVLRRTSTTARALLSIAQANHACYSLESLPRR